MTNAKTKNNHRADEADVLQQFYGSLVIGRLASGANEFWSELELWNGVKHSGDCHRLRVRGAQIRLNPPIYLIYVALCMAIARVARHSGLLSTPPPQARTYPANKVDSPSAPVPCAPFRRG